MPSLSTVTNALGRPPAVAATGVIAVLAVVWAAAVPRPERALSGLPADTEIHWQPPAEGFGAYEPDVELSRPNGGWASTADVVAGVLGWATIVVLVGFAAVALWFIGRAVVTSLHEGLPPPADDAANLDLEAVAAAVTTDATGRLTALSGGTPAEGIIAAWAHLEATLHEAGVPLPASRTSTEVTVDVLRRFAVDPDTLGVLARLYREARWSAHALTEADRSRAADAYRALDAAIRAGIPEPTGRRRG
jgi:hypothetical protein